MNPLVLVEGATVGNICCNIITSATVQGSIIISYHVSKLTYQFFAIIMTTLLYYTTRPWCLTTSIHFRRFWSAGKDVHIYSP